MDIRVTVGGVEAVVTVRDAAEAASLLSQLAAMKPQVDGGNVGAPARTRSVDLDGSGRHQAERPQEESNVKNALLGMKGKPVAAFLHALLDFPGGVTDDVVKKALKLGSDQHLGPQVSNVSKICKKFGIEKE